MLHSLARVMTWETTQSESTTIRPQGKMNDNPVVPVSSTELTPINL